MKGEHPLAEKVRTMVFAFDTGDSRRRAVLVLADEIQAELDRLAAVERLAREACDAETIIETSEALRKLHALLLPEKETDNAKR